MIMYFFFPQRFINSDSEHEILGFFLLQKEDLVSEIIFAFMNGHVFLEVCYVYGELLLYHNVITL